MKRAGLAILIVVAIAALISVALWRERCTAQSEHGPSIGSVVKIFGC